MTILLFGKNGQVGRELQRSLLPHGELVALGRDQVNLEKPGTIADALATHAPDIIVNAAAYTAVDKAESEEETARLINAGSVAAMSDYAAASGALLVHYSTDYVFDGEKTGAYRPDDTPNPQSAYGRTKWAGEAAIEASGCNHLIFRTSWVYAAHGNNFVKTMLRLAAEKDALNVVADQFGAPTSAELIADVSSLAIAGYRQGLLDSALYHLTAAGETTWHGLASYAIDHAIALGAPLKLNSGKVRAISTADYPTPAKRPYNSRLDCSELEESLGIRLPDWRVYVERVVEDIVGSGERKQRAAHFPLPTPRPPG